MHTTTFSSASARLVGLAWLSLSLGSQAMAAEPASDSTAPAYRSAFEGYKPYTTEPVQNWRQSNDSAARIGGWREYARQAQQPAAQPPAQAPDVKLPPDPHADHAAHAKP